MLEFEKIALVTTTHWEGSLVWERELSSQLLNLTPAMVKYEVEWDGEKDTDGQRDIMGDVHTQQLSASTCQNSCSIKK